MGLVTMLSLPNFGAWWTAPLGLGAIASWQRGYWLGEKAGTASTASAASLIKRWSRHFLRIYVFWIGAYGFGLIWLTDVTVPGWVIAVVIEAFIMAAPMAVAFGFSNERRNGAANNAASSAGAPTAIALASALVLGEAIRAAVPFGGVPLSNLALGAPSSPYAPIARLGGPLLTVAAIGLLAAAVASVYSVLPQLLTKAQYRAPKAAFLTAYKPVLGSLVLVVLFSIGGAIAPNGDKIGELEVAVLQSGGELGTRGQTRSQALDVFERHQAVTRANASDLADVDLLVWSESSISSDGPLEESPELAELQALVNELDTTIVANFYERTVGVDPPRFRNATVIVAPAASEASGYLGRYDKVHLVPFGEYIPLRSVIDRLADLSLVSRDAIAGTEPGVLPSPFGTLAVVSSFEIYFPGSVRSGVKEGGAVLVNPTLASSYRTDWVPQQSLASARLRAIETGRWVLQASTTGYSAVVNPAGDVIGRTGLGDPGVVIATAELREGSTIANFLSTWPIVLAALIAFGYTVSYAFRPYAFRPGQTS